MKNIDFHKYLRQVRGCLPNGKMKRQIMEEISSAGCRYLEENPGACFEDIVARLGTPQQIAASYIDEMCTPELLDNLRMKRRIIKIVSCAVALVIVAWFVVVGVALVQNYQHRNGYANTYIVVE